MLWPPLLIAYMFRRTLLVLVLGLLELFRAWFESRHELRSVVLWSVTLLGSLWYFAGVRKLGLQRNRDKGYSALRGIM